MEPLSHDRGGALFQDLIDTVPEDCHQVVACVGDHDRIRQALVASPGVFGSYIDVEDNAATILDRASDLPGITSGQQRAVLPNSEDIHLRLAELLEQVTGISSSEIDADDSWGDLGLTSAMLQELATEVSRLFGVDVPPNALFRYRTPTLLIEYLGLTSTTRTSQVPESFNQDDRNRRAYAIVGMDGVMPGGNNLDDFWQLLIENQSAVGLVERWERTESGVMAGTIDSYDQFDNAFLESQHVRRWRWTRSIGYSYSRLTMQSSRQGERRLLSMKLASSLLYSRQSIKQSSETQGAYTPLRGHRERARYAGQSGVALVGFAWPQPDD